MVKTSADRFQIGPQFEALGFKRKNKELLNLLRMEQLIEWNKLHGNCTFLIKSGSLHRAALIAQATWLEYFSG